MSGGWVGVGPEPDRQEWWPFWGEHGVMIYYTPTTEQFYAISSHAPGVVAGEWTVLPRNWLLL